MNGTVEAGHTSEHDAEGEADADADAEGEADEDVEMHMDGVVAPAPAAEADTAGDDGGAAVAAVTWEGAGEEDQAALDGLLDDCLSVAY
ncbi:hypothetical protein KEM52_003929 [Ascosphaera acerosa]|nr:hypothetical protein KEM52_003929 [Ascosphaera acerosa]